MYHGYPELILLSQHLVDFYIFHDFDSFLVFTFVYTRNMEHFKWWVKTFFSENIYFEIHWAQSDLCDDVCLSSMLLQLARMNEF